MDMSVGNILSDDVTTLRARLVKAHGDNTCHACWTSCRGNIDALRNARDVWGNVWDYHRMCKAQPLVARG
jgi:hypothetical protein